MTDKFCKCGKKKSKPSYERCSVCAKDYRKSAEYRERMSNACKGKSSWSKGLTKDNCASLNNMSKSKQGGTPWNKGKKMSLEQTEKMMGREPWNKGKKMSEEFCEKHRGRKHTEETKEIIRQKLLERIENGEINGSPKSKIFEYNGVKVQGGSELKWIKVNFDRIINTKKKGVKTPLGFYFPDFETADAYIEVKSQWTYSKMLEEQTEENSQYKKIQYVNDNIKPVEIYIDDNNGIEWAKRISKQQED